jgi:hypothetical protein
MFAVRENSIRKGFVRLVRRGNCIGLIQTYTAKAANSSNEGFRNYYLRSKIMTGILAEIAHNHGRKIFKYAYAS